MIENSSSILPQVNDLLKDRDSTKVCIALDWLSLYFKHADAFKAEYEEGDIITINPDCYLLAIDRPTLHFNTHFVLFYKMEEAAHVLLNSRNEKFFKRDIIKVDFTNHTLYSSIWQNVYQALLDYGLMYHTAGRVDIAIDGVNYLQKLLNLYAKQSADNKEILLKNSSEIRARFSAKVLNNKTMLFENFNIGSAGGNKMITVYNKSLEIVKSGKQYIQEYWLKNGVVEQLSDLQLQENEISKAEKRGYETFHLPGYQNIYRFEIRLKSEAIKEIKDFTPAMLGSAAGLANIVRTHCRKYFEGLYNDGAKVTDCTPFDLLPYDQLSAVIIAKIERQERDGIYKAKMTIHGIIQDLYKGYIKHENTNEVIETIFDRVARYNLAEYLNRKLKEWHSKYRGNISRERQHEVIILINHIEAINAGYLKETALLADNHNQAGATANFGE